MKITLAVRAMFCWQSDQLNYRPSKLNNAGMHNFKLLHSRQGYCRPPAMLKQLPSSNVTGFSFQAELTEHNSVGDPHSDGSLLKACS